MVLNVIAPLNVEAPAKYEMPVVVAPPSIVSPPVWPPLPIVVDAYEVSPFVNERVVEVALPGNGYPIVLVITPVDEL